MINQIVQVFFVCIKIVKNYKKIVHDIYVIYEYMNKHILFVLDYYLPHKGWSETVFEAIISRLLTKWYTISVITSHFDSKLPTKEHKEWFHIYRIGKSRVSFIFWALCKGIKIIKKIQIFLWFIQVHTDELFLPHCLENFFIKEWFLPFMKFFENSECHTNEFGKAVFINYLRKLYFAFRTMCIIGFL